MITRKKRPYKSQKITQCHPRLQNSESCLSQPILNDIASSIGAPSHLKGARLRHWLTRKTKCKSERCWVENANMDDSKKRTIIKNHFRPTVPLKWKTNPTEWLDTLNIKAVMDQYEEAYPEFKFYGANPIDFSAPDPYVKSAVPKCLEESLCKINLKELAASGKTKLGYVFNLDSHLKGGSHWVAAYTDIPGHRSYYFDSYGMRAPPQIARLLRSLTLQDPEMRLEYNARKFQYGSTECGMYCIYFLIQMLHGDTFQKFCRRAPRDNVMEKLRKLLYRQD